MKLLTTVIGILILLNTSLQAQNDAESKQSSKSFSLSEIFYKVRPVLDKKEKAELKQELTETQSRIDKAINYRTSLKDSIFMETKLDTVKIPVHLRMLGGYINIPKLTPIQKSAKDIQIEIKELDKKIENPGKEKQKILDTFARDEKYMEKNILFGFITWDSEKDTTQ